jgi:hypothetical protein
MYDAIAIMTSGSAHRMISDILDHPEKFRLSNSSTDAGSEEFLDTNDDFDELQDVWEDDIHLSRAVHEVFADRPAKIFDAR